MVFFGGAMGMSGLMGQGEQWFPWERGGCLRMIG